MKLSGLDHAGRMAGFEVVAFGDTLDKSLSVGRSLAVWRQCASKCLPIPGLNISGSTHFRLSHTSSPIHA